MILKNGYYINKSQFSDKDIINIKKELTVTPTATFSLEKVKNIIVYREEKDYLIVPRKYGIEKFGETKNNIPKGADINIKFKNNLRDYQVEIVNVLLEKYKTTFGGILSLPCGFGKTIIALYLASIFKVKTLIVVHKTFLMNQWKEKIKEFTDATCGTICQNTVDIDKDIVIGMLQSISTLKYDNKIFEDFGFVVFDEVHHAPSSHFSKSLPVISCNKCLGLSATPKRKDNLEKILFWYFGDILYKTKNNVSDVIVYIKNYTSTDESYKEYKLYNGEINRSSTLNKITELDDRNIFITNILTNILENKERKILVLSDRLSQLYSIEKLLNDNDITDIGYYIGNKKQKELEESEKCKVILGTYPMASEGLDIKSLNTLVMASPRRDIEQVAGRIVRCINKDIKPHIYDIVDSLPSFYRQGRHRQIMYFDLGFTIAGEGSKSSKYIDVYQKKSSHDMSGFIIKK